LAPAGPTRLRQRISIGHSGGDQPSSLHFLGPSRRIAAGLSTSLSLSSSGSAPTRESAILIDLTGYAQPGMRPDPMRSFAPSGFRQVALVLLEQPVRLSHRIADRSGDHVGFETVPAFSGARVLLSIARRRFSATLDGGRLISQGRCSRMHWATRRGKAPDRGGQSGPARGTCAEHLPQSRLARAPAH
jgi:hypothetical protein